MANGDIVTAIKNAATRQLLGVILAVVVLLVGFQNCAPRPSGGGNGNSSTLAGNNGQTYDGMRYSRLNTSGLCSDGSLFESSIQFVNGIAYLVRQNCQEIPSSQQVSVESQITMITSYVLTYQGNYYFAWLSLLSGVSVGSTGDVAMSATEYKGAFQNPTSYIASYDSSGRARWVLGNEWFPQYGPSVTMLPDASIIVAGGQQASGPAAFAGVWAARLGVDGSLSWSKGIKLKSSSQILSGFQSVATSDGRLLTVTSGCSTTAVSCAQLFLLSMNLNGDLLSVRSLVGATNVSGALSVSPQGEIFLMGALDQGQLYVAKIANDGHVIWSNIFSALNPNGQYLAFTSAGKALLSASFKTTVAAGVVIPSYRWLELNTSDGTVLTTYQWLPDQTILPAPSIIASGDGGYLAQFESVQQSNGSKSAQYVKLDANFQVIWAVLAPVAVSSDVFSNIQTFLGADNHLYQQFETDSKYTLPSSSTPVSVSVVQKMISLDPSCPGCSPLNSISGLGSLNANLPKIASNPTTQAGPSLSLNSSVVITDVTPPPFKNMLPDFISPSSAP